MDVLRTGRGSALLAVVTLPALALNPAYQISQYAHTSWRSNSGIAAVRRIKQTPDGYLWLATRSGLVRFDGVRFTTFKAGAETGLESSTAQDIVVDLDGSMWVATLGGGVAHYQRGKFRNYTVKDGLPSDEIGCLYRDSRGTLWVGTRGAGVARMVNGHFEKLPVAIPPSAIDSFLEGSDHSLWIATYGYGVFRLQDGTLTSFTVKDGLPDDRVDDLCQDHAGRIWTAGYKGISSWSGSKFIPDQAVNAVVNYAISCTEDRDGNFWIGSSSGLFRLRGGEVTKVDHSSGLSGDFTSDVYEDREGNLWAGTRSGLDRFRDEQVRLFRQPGGPVLADSRGVWTASNHTMERIAGNTLNVWQVPLPAGSTAVTLLSRPDAGFLIGFDHGGGSWSNQSMHLESDLAGLDVRCLLRAHEGSIWVETANRGLLRWVPSGESPRLTETGVSDRFITTLVEDRTGAIWAGSVTGGGVYRVADGKVTRYGAADGLRSPEVYTIFMDSKGALWIGSTSGLSWFEDGHIRSVNSRQGLPADQVFAILEDSYHRLWLLTYAGLARIDKTSLAEWAAGKRQNLNPTLYRNAEGLQIRTISNVFPNAARSADGHLWFSIADGLVEVTPPDPAALQAPQFPVLVEDVTVDGVPSTKLGRVRMPAGTRSVQLRYTALTLSDSEAVRFRYRLEGIDNDWIYADARRIAFYNNLKPRAYRFRVAARLGEEQWLEASPLVLDQLPFYYQTWWFRSLASLAAVSLCWFLYRLRLRQAVDRVQEGFQQRIDERTRIARDLHDTLLQSFQGLLFELQAARNLFRRRPEDAMRTLDSAIDSAEAAIAEGRDAIQNLRSGSSVETDLATLLTAAGKELSGAQNSNGDRADFLLTLEGPPRSLAPVLQDEIYRVAREILGNAFRHAHAKKIEVDIRYDDHVFRMRIRDDGIGIDPKVLAAGARPGHWGLPGVRERAKLVGAKLDFWSEAGAGTEVQLAIPASVAYPRSSDGRVFGLFRRATGRSRAE